MPAVIPVGFEVPVFIIGIDAQGKLGVGLNTGDSIAIVSADPNTVSWTPDATAGMSPADPNATPPVPSYQSILSGEAASAATPAQPGVPITLTRTLTFGNGNPSDVETDTVTVSPDVAVATGDIFGTPVAIPPATPPASARR